jgi:hypothetical protein
MDISFTTGKQIREKTTSPEPGLEGGPALFFLHNAGFSI